MSMLTVRQIDPADKAWLRAEAERQRISMEEMVRRLIHQGRKQAGQKTKPSEIVRRYFGPEGGVNLDERGTYDFVEADFPE